MSVFDDYQVDPRLSLMDKTRIQAQVLVPVLQAARAELGKAKADAIVRQALRGWSQRLFAAIGDGVDGSPRRKYLAAPRQHTGSSHALKSGVASVRHGPTVARDFRQKNDQCARRAALSLTTSLVTGAISLTGSRDRMAAQGPDRCRAIKA